VGHTQPGRAGLEGGREGGGAAGLPGLMGGWIGGWGERCRRGATRWGTQGRAERGEGRGGQGGGGGCLTAWHNVGCGCVAG